MASLRPDLSYSLHILGPRTSYTARDIMTAGNRTPAFALCRERAIGVDRQSNPPICVLANRTRIRVSSALSAHIEIGDEIAFPIPLGDEIGGEVYITKDALSVKLITARSCSAPEGKIAFADRNSGASFPFRNAITMPRRKSLILCKSDPKRCNTFQSFPRPLIRFYLAKRMPCRAGSRGRCASQQVLTVGNSACRHGSPATAPELVSLFLAQGGT
jgi:hypothetical protein